MGNDRIGELVRPRLRVPFSDHDAPIRASFNTGERWTVNLDISERALPQMAQHAIEAALSRLAYDINDRVLSSVYAALDDTSWSQGIIEDEIRHTVARVVGGMLKGEP